MTPSPSPTLAALLAELRNAPPPRCTECQAFENYFPHGDHPEDLQRCEEAGLTAHAFQPDNLAERAVLAHVEGIEQRANAWKEFAYHMAHCVECGEMNYTTCFDGNQLHDAAVALDPTDSEPSSSQRRAQEAEL